MIIQVDAEGEKNIAGLCDIALRTRGLQSLSFVTQVLNAVTPMKPQNAENAENAEKLDVPQEDKSPAEAS